MNKALRDHIISLGGDPDATEKKIIEAGYDPDKPSDWMAPPDPEPEYPTTPPPPKEKGWKEKYTEASKAIFDRYADIPTKMASAITWGALPAVETPEDAGAGHKLASKSAELLGYGVSMAPMAKPLQAIGALGKAGAIGGAVAKAVIPKALPRVAASAVPMAEAAAQEGLMMGLREAGGRPQTEEGKKNFFAPEIAERAKAFGGGAAIGAAFGGVGKGIDQLRLAFGKEGSVFAKAMAKQAAFKENVPGTQRFTPQEQSSLILAAYPRSALLGAGAGLHEPAKDWDERLTNMAIGMLAFPLAHAVPGRKALLRALDTADVDKTGMADATKLLFDSIAKGDTDGYNKAYSTLHDNMMEAFKNNPSAVTEVVKGTTDKASQTIEKVNVARYADIQRREEAEKSGGPEVSNRDKAFADQVEALMEFNASHEQMWSQGEAAKELPAVEPIPPEVEPQQERPALPPEVEPQQERPALPPEVEPQQERPALPPEVEATAPAAAEYERLSKSNTTLTQAEQDFVDDYEYEHGKPPAEATQPEAVEKPPPVEPAVEQTRTEPSPAMEEEPRPQEAPPEAATKPTPRITASDYVKSQARPTTPEHAALWDVFNSRPELLNGYTIIIGKDVSEQEGVTRHANKTITIDMDQLTDAAKNAGAKDPNSVIYEELTHAALDNIIAENSPRGKALREKLAEQRAAVITKLYGKDKKKIQALRTAGEAIDQTNPDLAGKVLASAFGYDYDLAYPLVSDREFLNHAMTHAPFQDLLGQVGNKPRTIWDRALRAVNNALGKKVKAEDTMLGAVLKDAGKTLQTFRPVRETPTTEPAVAEATPKETAKQQPVTAPIATPKAAKVPKPKKPYGTEIPPLPEGALEDPLAKSTPEEVDKYFEEQRKERTPDNTPQEPKKQYAPLTTFDSQVDGRKATVLLDFSGPTPEMIVSHYAPGNQHRMQYIVGISPYGEVPTRDSFIQRFEELKDTNTLKEFIDTRASLQDLVALDLDPENPKEHTIDRPQQRAYLQEIADKRDFRKWLSDSFSDLEEAKELLDAIPADAKDRRDVQRSKTPQELIKALGIHVPFPRAEFPDLYRQVGTDAGTPLTPEPTPAREPVPTKAAVEPKADIYDETRPEGNNKHERELNGVIGLWEASGGKRGRFIDALNEQGVDTKTLDNIAETEGWHSGNPARLAVINDIIRGISVDEIDILPTPMTSYTMIGKKSPLYNALKSKEFQGRYDGIWRKELSDKDARVNPTPHFIVRDQGRMLATKLSDVLYHPELFAAYPQLNKIIVAFVDMPRTKIGSFVTSLNLIKLNADIFLAGGINNPARKINLGQTLLTQLEADGTKKDTPVSAKTVLLHEMQHAIQRIEGFSTGASMSKGASMSNVAAYLAAGGERESRYVQRRSPLSQADIELNPSTTESYSIGGPNAKGFKEAKEKGLVFPHRYSDNDVFEIDTSKIKLAPASKRQPKTIPLDGYNEVKGVRLGNYITGAGDLFYNYPQLENIVVVLHDNMTSGANYDRASWKRRPLNDPALLKYPELKEEPDVINLRFDEKDNLEYLVHEIEHAIQDIEGLPRGSSPGDFMEAFYEKYPAPPNDLHATKEEKRAYFQAYAKAQREAKEMYNKTAGEIDARRSAERRGYTPEQRIAEPFYKETDTPREMATITSYSMANPFKEQGKIIQRGFKEAFTDLVKTFNPIQFAKETGQILRTQFGVKARRIAELEATLSEHRKYLGSLDTGQRMDFYSNVEKPDQQSHFTPEMKEAARTFSTIMETAAKLVQDLGKKDPSNPSDQGNGYLKTLIQDYFPHIWKDPRRAREILGDYLQEGELAAEVQAKSPLEGNRKFLMQRSIDYISTGLKLGLELKYDNPADAVFEKAVSMYKFVAARESLNQLKEKGLAKYYRIGESVPDGMTRIDDRIGTVYGAPSREVKTVTLGASDRAELQRVTERDYPNATPEQKESILNRLIKAEETKHVSAGGMVTRGYYYMPEDAARLLNNHVSRGIMEQHAAARGWYDLSKWVNSMQLGLSFFHIGFTSFDAITSGIATANITLLRALRGQGGATVSGALKEYATAWKAPYENYKIGARILAEYARPGTDIADIAVFADMVAKAGGRGKEQQWRTDINSKVEKLIAAGGLPNKAYGFMLSLPGFVESTTNFTMDFALKQKMGVFANIATVEMRDFPNATPEQKTAMIQKAWDTADNRMGQLVYDNLFWSKSLKDISMMTVRAVGWNLGSIREIGGGTVDWFKAIKGATQGESFDMTQRMSYIPAMILTTGIAGAIINYMATGQAPQDQRDYFFPRNGNLDANGRPERMSLPTYWKDTMHWGQKPLVTAMNKMHPALQYIGQLFRNQDFYGTQIYRPDDPIYLQGADVLKNFADTIAPFAIKGAVREYKLGQGDAQTFARAALPFIGITPAPAEYSKTKAENLLTQMTARRQPIGGRNRKQQEHADTTKAIRRAFWQSPAAGEAMLRKAQTEGKVTHADVAELRSQRRLTPLQVGFKRLGIDEALTVWESASEEERKSLRVLLAQKYVNALAKSVSKDRTELRKKYNQAVRPRHLASGTMPLQEEENSSMQWPENITPFQVSAPAPDKAWVPGSPNYRQPTPTNTKIEEENSSMQWPENITPFQVSAPAPDKAWVPGSPNYRQPQPTPINKKVWDRNDPLYAPLYNASEARLLAQVLKGEAAGESIEGQKAVGTVIMNRVNHPKKKYGDNLHDVLLHKYAFSYVNPDNIAKVSKQIQEPIEDKYIDLANGIMSGTYKSKTAGSSTHYLNPDLADPTWQDTLVYKGRIGKHKFYKES